MVEFTRRDVEDLEDAAGFLAGVREGEGFPTSSWNHHQATIGAILQKMRTAGQEVSGVVGLYHRASISDDRSRLTYVASMPRAMQSADGECDRVYAYTQNYDSSWSKPPRGGIVVRSPNPIVNGQELGHRSTSIGDVIQINLKFFQVASVGFTEIDIIKFSLDLKAGERAKEGVAS
jgi:hypothetical protein